MRTFGGGEKVDGKIDEKLRKTRMPWTKKRPENDDVDFWRGSRGPSHDLPR